MEESKYRNVPDLQFQPVGWAWTIAADRKLSGKWVFWVIFQVRERSICNVMAEHHFSRSMSCLRLCACARLYPVCCLQRCDLMQKTRYLRQRGHVRKRWFCFGDVPNSGKTLTFDLPKITGLGPQPLGFDHKAQNDWKNSLSFCGWGLHSLLTVVASIWM